MNTPHDDNRTELALDALIVGALRADLDDSTPSFDVGSAELDADDLRALNTLGPDLVLRLLAGQRQPQTSRPQPSSRRELATAMNRGDDTGELTDKAREEMEQRVEEENRSKGPQHDDDIRDEPTPGD